MHTTKSNIPIYGIDKFSTSQSSHRGYQIEVFDANRHFKVEYPHRHDFYEILYLSEGSGFHIIDSNTYKIEPPCIFFMTPGQTHKLELSKDIDGFIFLFAPEFYELNQSNKNKLLGYPFFHSVTMQNPPLYLSQPNDNIFIKHLFERGCLHVKNQSQNEEIIHALLDLILLTCKSLYPPVETQKPNSKGHITVKKFMLHIEENFQLNLKVSDYAEKLNITPNHLTQLVKQITGKTTNEIL